MAWRDDLLALQRELAAVRTERRQQAEAEEAEHQRDLERLSQLSSSLAIPDLLSEMNQLLLEGKGEIETFTPWDTNEDEVEEAEYDLVLDDEDLEEEGDVLTVILSWQEDGEREIAVDLGLTDEGVYLQVNGTAVRTERRALEQALVRAFREELEL
jgi:hypothetical protein